jgi:hypothetical protein
MTDIAIRKVEPAVLAQFRAGAAARGITQAEYLARLVELHERMREAVALDSMPLPLTILQDTGLAPVTH